VNIDPPPPENSLRRTTFADMPDKSFRFTAARRERLLLLLRATIPLSRCCERIGCSQDTPLMWAAAGREAIAKRERGEKLTEREEEMADFAEQFDNARTEAEVAMMTMVTRGAATDWRAAAWRLACLRPADYSERYQAAMAKIEAEAEIRAAQLAQARAAAALAEEKLATVREMRASGGKVLVVGAEDLVSAMLDDGSLPREVREEVAAWFNRQGFRLLEARDLGGGSEEEKGE
jgi:hypothetical protein